MYKKDEKTFFDGGMGYACHAVICPIMEQRP